MTITIEQQIAAVKREIAMREQVYPKFIAAKRLTQAKAEHEVAAMKGVLRTLEGLVTAAPMDSARPVAWIRGHHSRPAPDMPAEYDEELVAGDDRPTGDGWVPLYAHPAARLPQEVTHG